MHSPGINGEGELRGKPANPGSPGKMAIKTECVCVCVCVCVRPCMRWPNAHPDITEVTEPSYWLIHCNY